MAGKKGAQSAKDKAAPDATSDEPVMVRAIACKGMETYEYVATEAEAEDERAKTEKDMRDEGHKGKATKKPVRTAEDAVLGHYTKFGAYIVGEEADDTGESDDEEEPSGEAPEAFTDAEEALAAETLEKLRASDKPLTVAELHPETNEEGKEGYVPAGQIDKALKRMLVPRGLAALDGEAFVAVRPGALGQRRGELLAAVVKARVQSDDTQAITDAAMAEDAAALEKAGLAFISTDEDDGSAVVWANDEMAEATMRRGAIALVEDALPDCREGGAAVVVDGDMAAEFAKERANRERVEKDLEQVKGQRERLRAYLRERNVNTHVIEEPPAVEAPVKAVEGDRRETWTKVVDLGREGLADVAKELLSINREEERLKLRIESAKEAHAEHISGIKAQLGKLSDRKREIEREDETGRRTLTREAIVRFDWGTDEEIWIAADDATELERRPIRKGAQRTLPLPTAPSASPPDVMRILPPGEENGSEVAGTLAAAVASPGFAEKYAAAIGKDVTVDASGAVPVISVTERPKPPPLTVPAIRTELEKLVAQLAEGETITIADASVRLARPVFGVEPGATFTDLVQTAAKSGHKASSIHWEAREGKEWIGAPHLAKKAAVVQTAEDKLLAKIRAAGADGIPPSDLATDEEKAAFKVLKERGAVERNGKPGRGSRIVAKEHATNGASAEASA